MELKPTLEMDSLNEQQRESVLHIDGPHLILAGPGSGKTRVITHRIAHMMQNDVPSQAIVAMTFTNKAAEEMKKRLETLAPGNRAWVGTFHRFSSRILRQYASMVGLKENFSIFDSGDAKKLMKQAVINADIDLRSTTPDRIASEISAIKNAGVSHERFQPRPGRYVDAIVNKVFPEYQNLLKISNGVDFDDLLLHLLDLLRNAPDLREELDRRYAYMLVDEYQDTNVAQYQIIRMLNSNIQNITATGDPDQSIYGWRGANINNILNFEKDYPAVRVCRLEQNYRSTKSILAVADQLIANNSRRKKKTLFTDNDDGAPVKLVSYTRPEDEAANIVDSIAIALENSSRRPNDFAILYRTNHLSRILEHAFRRRRIPYQILKGFEFYQRKEIKDLLGYLHLINNPADGIAFERVINVPSRKIGKVTINRLHEFARANRLPLLEAARHCERASGISAAPQQKLKSFVALIDRLTEFSDREVPEIMQHVLQETRYQDWLTADGSEEGDERAKNIDELIAAAEEFEADFDGEGGLERYLEQAALVSDTDVWDPNAEYVTMMSLHAAKGLEFPVVFIIGLEEGILPHERNGVDEEKVEEERRLLFVGITRAEEELQISRCLNRFRRGGSWPVIPSRFLMELPRHEMQIFEPTSFSFGAGDLDEAVEGIGPFMNDGIPSYDINDDSLPFDQNENEPGGELKLFVDPEDLSSDDLSSDDRSSQNRRRAGGSFGVDAGGEDEFHESGERYVVDRSLKAKTRNMRDDAGSESNPAKRTDRGSDSVTDRGRVSGNGNERVKEKKALKLSLMTGSELAEQLEASDFIKVHPSQYKLGMEVEHEDYGIGNIVSLTGEGAKRIGLIEFPGLGKKRFHLTFARLRILDRPNLRPE